LNYLKYQYVLAWHLPGGRKVNKALRARRSNPFAAYSFSCPPNPKKLEPSEKMMNELSENYRIYLLKHLKISA
jgi:hypothetical protein